MTTINLTAIAALEGLEQIPSADSPAAGSGGNERQYLEYNLRAALHASSTPVVDVAPVDLSTTIAAGPTPTDFDLTAAPAARDINDAINLSGKKLIAALFKAATGNNAAGLTIGPQGANGYQLFGSTNNRVLLPGETIVLAISGVGSQKPTVAAGAKDIRVSGAVDDVLSAILYFGTP